ncbi:uncharacterized protein K452DRAFT_305348 [Aplosporella prunicola CBS 121167]|uniref:Uncharacterized protein n=1 Tax=Aplosporella prunicola CBS 121167 TaxID=1176127 RepID=A0A6A6BT43_9PEZI|nr:uncharacterized protein K452DRAFT_305348 [Aplosporella prunicola CBS 121167]KAF2146414.1 hypothetical protein K452DRAFT_305348 [Aplosporella prunicola CBS 121167]
MASFSRLALLGITGVNENTLALAKINIDFSLLKVTPSKEFNDVGKSLSEFRRQEAEDRNIHRTSRKLGEVFEPTLLITLELLRAYGIRILAISKCAVLVLDKNLRLFKKNSGVDAISI